MNWITLTGAVDPAGSFALRDELEPLTSSLRPSVTVDLSTVEDLHPSVVSVLIRHRRQARRQGGNLHLIRPIDPAACRTLDHVGLVGAGAMSQLAAPKAPTICSPSLALASTESPAELPAVLPAELPAVLPAVLPAELSAELPTESSTDSPSIRRASIVLSAATLAASGANYVLNLLLARWMSPSEFGDANLIVTVMLGITAVAVALQLIAAHRISTADADRAAGHRRHLLGRAWIVGTGVAVTMTVAAPALRSITSSASALPFVLLAIGLPCYLAQAVERGVLQGQLLFGRLAQTLVVEAAVRLGIAIALVSAGFGVVGATAGITASFVASWWWGRRAVRSSSISSPGSMRGPAGHTVDATVDRTSAESRATQATMILLVGQIVINNGDVVLAKMLFDADSAGVYSVVALIGRAIFFLSWSVVTAAFPHAAKDGGHAVQRQAVRTVAAMSIAMTIAVALAAPALTPIVFGEDYRSAGSLFAPYAIATSLFTIANVYATLGVARGRRRPAWIIVGGSTLQTILLTAAADTPSRMVWLQVVAMGLLLVASWWTSRRRPALAG